MSRLTKMYYFIIVFFFCPVSGFILLSFILDYWFGNDLELIQFIIKFDPIELASYFCLSFVVCCVIHDSFTHIFFDLNSLILQFM